MGYQRPVSAPISSSWQDHKNRVPTSAEPGTDYACGYGTDILAAEDGVVSDLKGTTSYATGRYLTIDLDDGKRVRYLHLSAIHVSVGQRIGRGQKIASSGGSAYGSNNGVGSHVHTTLFPTHTYSFAQTLDFEANAGERWTPTTGAPSYSDGAVGAADPGGYNPFGIAWSKGLQKIARLYGYSGAIDAQFGPGSKAGFAQFLRANWGYAGNDELGPVMWSAIARWLRARYGYVGNDVPGPVMRGALGAAENKNYLEL